MATDYKKNASEAKKAVASLPKAQRAAAQKVIAQATKTGKGLSNNELAFLKANASKLTNTTDPKAFLGTLAQRQTFLQSQASPTPDTPEVSAEEAARRAAQEVENARLQTQRTDWSEYLSQVFESYGLGTLSTKIKEYVQQGFTPDTVTLKLQETPEYQQRFAGNTARKKAGLPVLSPAEYLATESAYRQTMRAAGLPAGFYDTPEDFSTFIGVDVSPSELKQRVDVAAQTIEGADPFFKQQLKQYYGVNDADMVAYALDAERALPTLLKQTQAVQFGAEAARQGIQPSKTMAETYAGLGVSKEQARVGFEQIAMMQPTAEKLSQISSGSRPVGLEELTSATFGGTQSAEAKMRIQNLAQEEQSRFAGQAGVGRGSLSRGTSGQF
jgi:hypothetical protein